MGIYIERATQQANVELATSRSEGIDVVFIGVEAMQQAMGRNRCCACYIVLDGIDDSMLCISTRQAMQQAYKYPCTV